MPYGDPQRALEVALIGCAIGWGRVCPRVTPEHFASTYRSETWRAILALHAERRCIDPISIAGRMPPDALKSAGGVAGLCRSADGVPRSTRYKMYGRDLIHRSEVRMAIEDQERARKRAVATIRATSALDKDIEAEEERK